ncbi:MAG: hypothetical protein EOM74_05315, partial [Methanomicrobia archaeon]|nr:hypothetical protein [Methanomicrobia archaeon]
TPSDLDHIATDILPVNDIKKFFKKDIDKYPLIKDLLLDLTDLSSLEKAIHKVIAPNLSIFDDASPALRSIRRKIKSQEDSIAQKAQQLVHTYADFLSDTLITMRNGHVVLPVKSANKNKVSGIIHDLSDTGLTTFIEPNILVEMNNELVILKSAELEEINYLLKLLTKQVIEQEIPLIANNKLIGFIDFVDVKARYALSIDAFVCEIVKEGRAIEFKRARHPLLDPKKVVANDFMLNDDSRVIVISGPNAGGKTVALKTVGLLVMMHQSGLAVPLFETGKLSFFRQLHVDIGDSQSISDNLSTFTGHLTNLISMSNIVSSRDLVLIDEAHLIAPDGEGMYRTFLNDMKIINPNVRMIGLTATPFRLKGGLICKPENMLNHVCYEAGLKEMIVQGYLSPLVSKAGRTEAKLDDLHIRGGEFI